MTCGYEGTKFCKRAVSIVEHWTVSDYSVCVQEEDVHHTWYVLKHWTLPNFVLSKQLGQNQQNLLCIRDRLNEPYSVFRSRLDRCDCNWDTSFHLLQCESKAVVRIGCVQQVDDLITSNKTWCSFFKKSSSITSGCSNGKLVSPN
jgi:hypothetical protein